MITSILTRIFAAVVILPLMLASSAALAADNIVVNGDFEQGNLSGWQLGGNSGSHSVFGSAAHSGGYGFETGPIESVGSISQTLPTVPGRTYRLEYWLANGSGGTNKFEVTWDRNPIGSLGYTDAESFEYTRFNAYDLVATSTTTILTFTFRHDPSFFLLDSVSVIENEIAADFAMLSATTPDSKRVDFTYSVSDASVGPVTVAVYRSADETFDAADVLVASTTILDLKAGSGSVPANLVIDPARPYVLVIADPANAIQEVDEENNSASFRKRVVGIVTSGFQLVGNLPVVAGVPTWVGEMADALERAGYSKTVAVDWSAYNNAASPGQTTLAAGLLANDLHSAVEQMKPSATDVIDTHWIGHSRGAVVNSEALELLVQDGSLPAPLSRGWVKMTMLDPHPAKNGPNGPLCSFDAQSQIGWLLFTACAAFQAVAQDPDAHFPARVNAPEVYFQHTSYLDAPSWERFINLWGVSTLISGSRDWTHHGLGHAEIHEAYRISEIETFTASATISSTLAAPSAPIWLSDVPEEIGQFYPQFVTQRGVAQSLLAKLGAARASLGQGNITAGRGSLNAFIEEVNAQRDVHIQSEVADLLIAAARSILSVLP